MLHMQWSRRATVALSGAMLLCVLAALPRPARRDRLVAGDGRAGRLHLLRALACRCRAGIPADARGAGSPPCAP